MRLIVCLILTACWQTVLMAQEYEPWPAELYDPALDAEAADLVLPMDCGAAMAFQRVAIPVDADDPLADRRVRLGQTQDASGYSDYLRPAFLRGPFRDSAEGGTHFYISRYELTEGQYRALKGDCAAPTRKDRLAKGGLSWFQAVEVAQLYSGWLLANRPANLPIAGDAPGFVRLPTEAEWEYAARGGARVDATQFAARTFFADGDMRDFARHQAPGSSRGKVGPVGLRQANPLGLYDVYGNAEELMLEPFRLNVVGRAGGQVGGLVTRGGSVESTSDQLYSAVRSEYPPFNAETGAPLSSPTFGVRLVISSHITSSVAQIGDIKTRWQEIAAGDGSVEDENEEPLQLLSRLIGAEIDPRRQASLSGLQLEFRRANDRVQNALQQSARATLLAGAVFVETLIENQGDIDAKAANIRMLVALPSTGGQSRLRDRQITRHVDEINQMRGVRSTYLLSFRTALESLISDVTPIARAAAYDVLREEMSLAGRQDLLVMLDRFWADIAAYEAEPDMDAEALSRLALE